MDLLGICSIRNEISQKIMEVLNIGLSVGIPFYDMEVLNIGLSPSMIIDL